MWRCAVAVFGTWAICWVVGFPIPIAATEVRSEVTSTDSLEYREAFEFASIHGASFSKFVLKHRRHKKTIIAVLMGGSEHLGTLLRSYLKLNDIRDVQVINVWINRSITGYWRVTDGKALWVGAAFKELPNEMVFDPNNRLNTRPQNTLEELVEYTSSIGLWNAEEVIAVDTGFFGAMPDSLHLVGKAARYQGRTVGVLYGISPVTVENLTMPMYGYTVHENNASRWAYSLDQGYSRADIMKAVRDGFGNRVTEVARPSMSFQRSRPKVSKLIKDSSGLWQPLEGLFQSPEKIKKNLNTDAGLNDGLTAAAGSSKIWISSLCRRLLNR